MKVVVVEDEADIGMMLRLLADLLGHDVTLLDPLDALAHDYSGVDLVITDWRMEPSGRVVMDHVMAVAPQAQVVVYTADLTVTVADVPDDVVVIRKTASIAELEAFLADE